MFYLYCLLLLLISSCGYTKAPGVNQLSPRTSKEKCEDKEKKGRDSSIVLLRGSIGRAMMGRKTTKDDQSNAGSTVK